MGARTFIGVSLSCLLTACEGGSEGDPPVSLDSSTGQIDPGSSEGSEAGDAEAGGATDSGASTDASTTGLGGETGESTGTTGDADDAASLELLNVQSAASAMNGDSLIIADYTVPADGILVVRGGAAGPTVQTVTFAGEPLTAVESHDEPDYWFAISADMYWMPVQAGQSGDIAWQYSPGDWTTRRRGAIAATVSGADQVHVVTMATDGLGTNEGRSGPFLAEAELTTTQESLILSAFTSNGPGPSDLVGPGHTLDDFPTIPIEEFHSTRVYAGHVRVDPGTFTVGYQNSENGWFDYILVLAAFSRG